MAYDIFLKIKGIKGDTTDDKHKEWIEVKSYRHKIEKSREGGVSSEYYSGRLDGELAGANHYDFEVLKKLDAASPVIFQYCHKNTHIPTVELELCRAMGDKTPFMRYTLGNVMITHVEANGEDNDDNALPMELVKFRYSKIDLEYITTTPTKGGRKIANIMFSVDLGEGTSG